MMNSDGTDQIRQEIRDADDRRSFRDAKVAAMTERKLEEQSQSLNDMKAAQAKEHARRSEERRRDEEEGIFKQALFDFRTLLDKFKSDQDPVVLLAQIDSFEQLRESNSWNAAFLRQMGDKNYFQETQTKAEELRATLDDGDIRSYEEFTQSYTEYATDRSGKSWPNPGTARFTEKPIAQLPKRLQSPPKKKKVVKALEPSERLEKLRKDHSMLPVYILLSGILFYKIYGWYKDRPERLRLEEEFESKSEDFRIEQEALVAKEHTEQLAQWKVDKSEAEEKIEPENIEIAKYNSKIHKNIDKAVSDWEKESREIRKSINAFIASHSGLMEVFSDPGKHQSTK